jgi:hypothetical protein
MFSGHRSVGTKLAPTHATTDNLKGAMSPLKVILLTIRCREAFRSTDARMQTLRSKTLDIDIFAKADWTLFGGSLDRRGGWWCVVSRVRDFPITLDKVLPGLPLMDV